MQLMDDFAPVITAVKHLRDHSGDSTLANVFHSDRFDAVTLAQAVMSALGFPLNQWCCAQPKPMPTALAHSEITADAKFGRDLLQHGALNTFINNCGRCHRTQMTQPPNYLAGDKGAVVRNIAHCAERIFVRLSMWDLKADERPKSPMPPPHSLKATGASLQAWRKSRDRATLKDYVSGILKAERGRLPTLEALLDNGYDATRPCLAQRTNEISRQSQ